MAISNGKQDMPLEDGGWVVNVGPLTMAIFNRKQDMSWGLDIQWGSSYDGYLQQEARYAIRRWGVSSECWSSYDGYLQQEARYFIGSWGLGSQWVSYDDYVNLLLVIREFA